MATDALVSSGKALPAVMGRDGAALPSPPWWSHAPARATCAHVLQFCGELHPTNKPVLVPVRPHLLYGYGPAPMGRCYEGVSDYQQRVGGTYQHGWMIWQIGEIYLRAYHHCVHWDGRSLTDVSPQTEHQILFLPTSAPGVPDEAYREGIRQGDSHGVKSRYFPLSDSPVARRIISLHESKDQARKHSTEWFGLLAEIGRLEVEFHDWWHGISASAWRRRRARSMSRIGK